MKKALVFITAIILVFALVSCGGESANTSDDGGGAGVSQTQTSTDNGTQVSVADIGDIDLNEVLSGATDKVWGKQDEATKQAMIDAGKEQGVDISFGADGSMTVYNTGTGETLIQNPDGSWVMDDGSGGSTQLGGDWPDNEFTKLIPKPEFNIVGVNVSETEFSAVFTGTDVAEIKAYAQQIMAAGFNVDADEQDMSDQNMYMLTASNSDGYSVTVSSASGTHVIVITKP